MPDLASPNGETFFERGAAPKKTASSRLRRLQSDRGRPGSCCHVRTHSPPEDLRSRPGQHPRRLKSTTIPTLPTRCIARSRHRFHHRDSGTACFVRTADGQRSALAKEIRLSPCSAGPTDGGGLG